MMNKFFHKIILFIILVSVFIFPLSTFLIYIFASEKEFTPEEVEMLKNTSRMRIVVSASSWLERPKDIRSAIVGKLVEFTIVPQEDTNYDATMFVDYKEAKGMGYGIIKPAYNGTDIRCSIRIDHNKLGTVFEREFNASTSYPSVTCRFGWSNDCLRDDAFKNLKEKGGFESLWEDILKSLKKR